MSKDIGLDQGVNMRTVDIVAGMNILLTYYSDQDGYNVAYVQIIGKNYENV